MPKYTALNDLSTINLSAHKVCSAKTRSPIILYRIPNEKRNRNVQQTAKNKEVLTLSVPRENNRRAGRHGLVNHGTDHTIHVANIHPHTSTCNDCHSQIVCMYFGVHKHTHTTETEPEIPRHIPGDGITQSEQTSAKSLNSHLTRSYTTQSHCPLRLATTHV